MNQKFKQTQIGKILSPAEQVADLTGKVFATSKKELGERLGENHVKIPEIIPIDKKIFDEVKSKLFNRLKIEIENIDYSDYNTYKTKFAEIPKHLLDEWKKIDAEYRSKVNNIKRLKGFLYESLFYYACLKTQTIFLDAEIVTMGEAKNSERPPWFSCVPLYDIKPILYYRIKTQRKIRVPQIEADFIITFMDKEGSSPPSFIDVKSKKQKYNKNWGWYAIAAMRTGFIFQIAYPKSEKEIPTDLKDWEIKTPCSNCKKLSDNYETCSECNDKIFPFTLGFNVKKNNKND